MSEPIYKGKGAVTAPPTIEQRASIAAVAKRLGIPAPKPDTQANARYMLDEFYHRERKQRRVRYSGSTQGKNS